MGFELIMGGLRLGWGFGDFNGGFGGNDVGFVVNNGTLGLEMGVCG